MKTGPGPQHGGVLLVVLIISMVIGVSVVSVLQWAEHENRLTARSKAWNAALPLAESGIEEALALLAYTNNYLSSGWQLKEEKITKRRNLGTDYYVAAIDTNTSVVTVDSRGFVKLPLTETQFVDRTIQVTVTNEPLFKAAIILKDMLNLDGFDLVVDSYDSSDPAASTAGRYDPAKRGDVGHVMTGNGVKSLLPLLGSAMVYGHMKTASGGLLSLLLGNNGAVGSLGWHLGGSKGIQPGYYSNDFRYAFPDIKPPAGALPATGGVVGTKAYQYVLPTGQWLAKDVTGSVYVNGNASLTVSDSINLVNPADAVTVASGASLKVYMLGKTAYLGGGGVVNENGYPINFQYYGGPNNLEVYLTSPSFNGLVYAPNAKVTVGGLLQPSVNMMGAIVANTMRVAGRYQLHYDESVQSIKSPVFRLASWEER